MVAAVNGGLYYGGGLIYVSTDAGSHWTATSAPTNYWSAIYSSPNGAKLVALANGGGVGGGSIYISTNSGTNWTVTGAPKA